MNFFKELEKMAADLKGKWITVHLVRSSMYKRMTYKSFSLRDDERDRLVTTYTLNIVSGSVRHYIDNRLTIYLHLHTDVDGLTTVEFGLDDDVTIETIPYSGK